MPNVDRRRFLQLAGGAAALTALPTSIARAAAVPAHRGTGTLADVEHIVVLMQENRAFDHMFGTMRGVRGFGDPHPAVLPSGKPVWHQPDGRRDVLPFRPDVDDLGLAFVQDLDHSWNGQHEAFHGGRWDQWIPAKGTTTMAHLERRDMPFHYALADAFTVCDAYHCSLLSSTDPNRYYMWTGWVGNDGKGGGPVIGNDELGYSWTTYPERLEAAGVSWKIYQDVGTGLDAAGGWGWTDDPYIGNYGDNSLLYFDRYRTARPGDPFYDKARTGTHAAHGDGYFGQLAADVKGGRLPQISWIVAPEAFSEHPNWPVNYGAWYTAKVLDALTADPEVWSKTALFITYDENDGFFDHVVPAYPDSDVNPGASTVPTDNELYTGAAGVRDNYGLGARVPMVVVSPWSTGGWVCSQTFDHTSIVQFMERRFGVHEPNITPWRRAVCGDLTTAFDFGRTQPKVPVLPATGRFRPEDHDRHPDYVPPVPRTQSVPTQESGTRPSRALGYALEVDATTQPGGLALQLRNTGTLGAQLQLRRTDAEVQPRTYTLAAGTELAAAVAVTGDYDVHLHGPDGFYRRCTGATSHPGPQVQARPSGDRSALVLQLANPGASAVRVAVDDVYSGRRQVDLAAGGTVTVRVPTARSGGWYDVRLSAAHVPRFSQVLAGRIDTGRPGVSDPQLGG